MVSNVPRFPNSNKPSPSIVTLISCVQKGYSQAEIARLLGRQSQGFIFYIKKGSRHLTPEQIRLLESLPLRKEINFPKDTKWSRDCPSCGMILSYRSKISLERQKASNSLCHRCASKMDEEQITLVAKYHALGLGNRKIAQAIGCNHRTVANCLKELGLVTNNPRGKPPVETSPTKAICSHCGEEVLKTDFALVQSYEDGRRLSKCRKCRKQQEYARLTNDLKAYLRDKEVRCQVRAKKLGIAYTLPYGYVSELYEKQHGCCFYTDTPLTSVIGQGRLPTAVSIDKVDPQGGYTPDNVVLCADRVNSIKKDITFEEMSQWMPGWYERVMAEAQSGRIIIHRSQNS